MLIGCPRRKRWPRTSGISSVRCGARRIRHRRGYRRGRATGRHRGDDGLRFARKQRDMAAIQISLLLSDVLICAFSEVLGLICIT
jgi:hypothetical protein